MPRLTVNRWCNVVTGDLSKAYVRNDGSCNPEITVPGFRLRLDVRDAEELAKALIEAVAVAKQQEGWNGGV